MIEHEGVETGTPSEKVVSYLARYANRLVIANDRLIKIEDGEVFFRYKDYRDHNQWKTLTKPVHFTIKRIHGPAPAPPTGPGGSPGYG